VTDSAQAFLYGKVTLHPQKVNRMVSFLAIKDRALDLLLSDQDSAFICKQLTELFLTNPTQERKDRNSPRKKLSTSALLDDWKRQRTHCF